MTEIKLVGISGTALNEEQRQLISSCRWIVASSRHRQLLAGIDLPLIPIAPVREMLARLEEALAEGDVAVLASGDPLFFGVGRTLIDRFGGARVRILPAVSAVQLACSRFALPWDDLPILSLHGRSMDELAGRILRHQRVLLFTDRENSPDLVAATLRRALEDIGDASRCAQIRLRVAENLGLPDERLVSGNLEEIGRQRFAALNMMLIEQPPMHAGCRFGQEEAAIEHSRGLITKDEVRAVILHRLQLPEQGMLWDIGGGSGSISVEAARLCPGLAVRTIERSEEQLEHIRANIRRFSTYNVVPVAGEAPEVLTGLPAPDRVFIGGSGGQLAAIVQSSLSRMPIGGRIVVSAVLDTTAEQAPQLLAEAGCRVDCRRIRISRWSWPDKEERQLNPITIITGVR